MREAEYRRAIHIFVRNNVRNDAEWHVLNRLICNEAGGMLSPLEREQAERLIQEYRPKGDGSS